MDNRQALCKITRAILDQPFLWHTDGRAQPLRWDLELLLGAIDEMESATALNYLQALSVLLTRLPDRIAGIRRGDLARLANATQVLYGIWQEHGVGGVSQVFTAWMRVIGVNLDAELSAMH